MIWPWVALAFIAGFFAGAGMILVVWNEDDKDLDSRAAKAIYGENPRGKGKERGA